MQETRVQSLGWEDTLEKRMATHSSILLWRISWTEEPGGLGVHGVLNLLAFKKASPTPHLFSSLLA